MIKAAHTPRSLIDHLFATGDALARNILNELRSTAVIEKRIARPKALVFIVDNQGQKEVLRLSVNPLYSSNNVALAYEAWVKIGIPVPTVENVGSKDTIDFLLMSYINDPEFSFGAPLASQQTTAKQMGSFLARMRAVPAKGFGYLDKNGHGTLPTWNDLLKTYYPHDWLHAEGHITSKERTLLQQIKNDIRFENQPTLLHGDYKPKNMFITENGEVTAVTDPKPMAGDPLWDIAVFNHFVYREQARQHTTYNDKHFGSLRKKFAQGYVAELGRTLTAEEDHTTTLYEILIDAGKVENLLRDKKEEAEGEAAYILDYLRHKIRLLHL